MDATPEAPDPDLLKRMEGLARKVFDAAGGYLSAAMQAQVSIHPGGLTVVRFTAISGEVLGKGVNEQRMEFGDGPETVAAKLLERVAEGDIARKIRTEHLHRLAAELGYRLNPKKKGD